MSKEAFFISRTFLANMIGDDGADYRYNNKVYSKDLFCEDIHFKSVHG